MFLGALDDQRAMEGADLGIMVGLIGPSLGPCGETYFLIRKLAGRYPEAADGTLESEERPTFSSGGRDRAFSNWQYVPYTVHCTM